MKREHKLVFIVFIAGTILGLSAFLINRKFSTESIVHPLSKSANIFSFFNIHEKPRRLIYGYLPYWNLENSEYLQLDKLTHIAYFGLYLKADGNFVETTEGSDGYLITEPGRNNWDNNDNLSELIKKCNRRNVRVALTVIAHVDEDTDTFLDCRSCWDTLLSNLIIELNSKNITDVNLNFEHVGQTSEDKMQKFVELTDFLNTELDKVYGDSYLVVSAFADSTKENRISSKLDELSKVADGVFVMAYDFHRPSSETVGPVSPIEGPGYNINQMLKDHLAQIPPNKLIMGIPYYGYNWPVESSDPYAKRIEGSDFNGYSQSQSYEMIQNTILEIDPEIKWNEEGKAPYFTYVSPETETLRTAYYENVESLEIKYDLINQNDLAGVGIWALGYDGGYIELWDLLYEKFIK